MIKMIFKLYLEMISLLTLKINKETQRAVIGVLEALSPLSLNNPRNNSILTTYLLSIVRNIKSIV